MRYTDNEVRAAVRILQKWRADDRGTPFPLGAIPLVLWALEQADPSLRDLDDSVLLSVAKIVHKQGDFGVPL